MEVGRGGGGGGREIPTFSLVFIVAPLLVADVVGFFVN